MKIFANKTIKFQSFSKLFLVAIFATTLSIASSLTAFAAATTPAISSANYKTGVSKIMVNFNVPVWADSGHTLGLSLSDFQLGGTCGFSGSATISSVNHTAGNTWALLTMAGAAGADETACTIAAKADNVFNIFTVGGAVSEKTIALTSDTAGPTVPFDAGKIVAGSPYVLVSFNEPVFGDSGASTAVDYDAFTLTNGNAAGCDVFVDLEVTSAGVDFLIEKCATNAVAGDAPGVDTFDFTDNVSVYDALGNASTTGTPKSLISVALGPELTYSKVHTDDAAAAVDTAVNYSGGLIKFSYPAFNASTPNMSSDLETTDFSYTDTGAATRTISGVTHMPNQQWTAIYFSSNFAAVDLTTATVDTLTRANATAIYDTWGRTIDTATLNVVDNTRPVILSIEKDTAFNNNMVTIYYSETVKIGTWDSISESGASTSSVGDTTTAGTIAGFGTFSTTGNVTVPTTKNMVLENGDLSSFSIMLAYETGGYMDSASSTEPSSIFTPNAVGTYVTDFEPNTGNGVEATSVQSTITATTAWDLTKPILGLLTLTDSDNDGRVDTGTIVLDSAMRDSSLTNANGAIGGQAGAFATGVANDETTVFIVTDDSTIGGSAAGDGDFLYSGATTKWTDRSGNLLNTAGDGTVAFGDITETDNAKPVLFSATKGILANQNITTFVYSEPVYIDITNQDGTQDAGDYIGGETLSSSTSSFGGITAAAGGAATAVDTGTIENIGSFGTMGSVVPSAQTNNRIAVSADGETITVTLNTTSGSYFTTSGTEPSGVFTPKDGLYILAQAPSASTTYQRYNIVATAPTATGSWDVTPPSTMSGLTFGGISGSLSDQAIINWASQGALGDFSRYVLSYGTTAGVDLSSSLWTTTQDATLGTRSTTTSTITGLTNGSTYYNKAYAIDIAGNVSTGSTEVQFLLRGSSSNSSSESSSTPTTTTTTTTNTTTPVPTTEPTTEPAVVPEPTPEPELTPEEKRTEDKKEISESSDKVFIEWAIKEGIFQGNADGTFAVNKAINRAEVAAVFNRVLGFFYLQNPEVDPYSDVSKNEWYAGYIQKMKDLKFVSGKVSTYGPEVYASKVEFLKFAMNVYKLLSPTEVSEIKTLEEDVTNIKFDDVSATAWYAPDVAAASAKGFLEGMGTECNKGTCFFANATITRGKATELLYNMFNKILGE